MAGPTQKRGQYQKWLHHHCILGVQKWAELPPNACIFGVSSKKHKIKSGYITLAFSGA